MTNNNPQSRSRSYRIRFSVRFRIIAGLVAIMATFSGLTIYSIILYRRTVEDIALINESYMPLTQGAEEVRSVQLVFNTDLDRLPDDPNQSATRDWLNAARRFRPNRMSKLIRQITVTLQMRIPADESDFMRHIRRKLRKIKRHYIANETQFHTLYELMDTGRIDEARFHVEGLKRTERKLDALIASIGMEVKGRITLLSSRAESDGVRATWILGILTVLALVIAFMVAAFSNRLLTPLQTLQNAVEQVAEGDFKTHIDITSKDEIGALASGFNHMTVALWERDQKLIRSERLAAAGKMAAQVTHEIRNPLSSLGLNAELLEEDLSSDAPDYQEAKTLLGAMQTEIERLTGITESYLRFARLPSPEPTYDQLNDMVDAATEFIGSEISGRKIELKVETHPEMPLVLFDRNQIRQALINLIRNAAEAIVSDGAITITTSLTENDAVISVKDTGGGIPDQSIELIFESFFSTRSGGTGLGLPLVKQICLAHGGNVKLVKTSPNGSTFAIFLPLEKEHP